MQNYANKIFTFVLNYFFVFFVNKMTSSHLFLHKLIYE